MAKRKIGVILLITILLSMVILGGGCGGGNEAGDGEKKKDAYPTKPVQLLCPWAPGGDSDILMRLVAQHIEKYLGTNVVVVNEPGVSGTLGLQDFVEKPADGYNIAQVHDSLFVSAHTDATELKYDDFEAIGSIGYTPYYLAAYKDAPFDTFEEFVEYAKDHELKIGITLRSTSHAAAEALQKALGIKFQYVSYEGTSNRTQALAGGFIDIMPCDYFSVSGFVEGGEIKYLASLTKERIAKTPDIPASSEAGFDGIPGLTRYLVVPKGTPENAKAALVKALGELSKDAEFVERVEDMGVDVKYVTGSDFQSWLEEMDAFYKDLTKDM